MCGGEERIEEIAPGAWVLNVHHNELLSRSLSCNCR